MKIFCVGNELFSIHQESEHSQAEEYRSLSGIPRFRNYCQLIPVDAQERVTAKFVEHDVKSLVTSIRQWCLTGIDPMVSEKGVVIRKVLSDALESLLQVLAAYRNHL